MGSNGRSEMTIKIGCLLSQWVHSGYMYDTPKNPYSVEHRGAFHLRRLAGNVAGKLGNAYLRYQNRQPATCFPLTATPAMLAIPVLPKAP